MAVSSGVSAKEIEAINCKIVHYVNVILNKSFNATHAFLTAFPLK